MAVLSAAMCALPAIAVGPPEKSDAVTQDAATAYVAIKSRALQQWSALKGLRAATTKVVEFGDGEKRALQRVVGQYEYMKADGKHFVRWDTVNMTAIRMDEADTMTRERQLIVHDGEFIYILLEESGKARAEKFASGTIELMPIGGPEFFESMERSFNLEVLAPTVLNDRPVHLIEAHPKKGGDKVLFFIDRENGILLKKHSENESEDSYESTTTTKVETDVAFEKGHFVFAAPEGVEVYDGTQRVTPAAPAEKSDAAKIDEGGGE